MKHLPYFCDVYDSERAQIIARVGSIGEAHEYIAHSPNLAGRRILIYETDCVYDAVLDNPLSKEKRG